MAITKAITSAPTVPTLGSSGFEADMRAYHQYEATLSTDLNELISEINDTQTEINATETATQQIKDDAEDACNLIKDDAETAQAAAEAAQAAAEDVVDVVAYTAGAEAYSSLTTYSKHEAVIGSDGNTYRSLVNGNIDNDPTTDAGSSWLLLTGGVNAFPKGGITLPSGAKTSITHPAVVNEAMDIVARMRVDGVEGDTLATYTLDNSSKFTQEDPTKTYFNGGVLTLWPSIANITVWFIGGQPSGSTTFVNSVGGFALTAAGAYHSSPPVYYYYSTSLYFSNGGTITMADGVDVLGPGDWTVEANIYLTDLSNIKTIFMLYPAAGEPGARFSVAPTGKLGFYEWNGAGGTYETTTTVSLNTWTHVAWSKSGTTVRMFINGVLGGTGTSTTNLNDNLGPVSFGNYVIGYMDNIKISQVARYTGNFTPAYPWHPLYDYPYGDYYHVVTNASGRCDLSDVLKISSASVSSTEPASTAIKFLVSFDGGTTWEYRPSGTGSWTTSDLSSFASNSMTKAEFIAALTDYTPGAGETLDIAAALYTSDQVATPVLDSITLYVNRKTYYERATIGRVGADTDLGERRINPTTTEIINQDVVEREFYITVFMK